MGPLWCPLLLLLGSLSRTCQSSRVLELSAAFPKVRKSGGMWLVQFYAPWCGHCKRLEPVWIKVAQALAATNIRVGRVDVTSYPSVGSEFKAYATPTIKFLKPDSEHTYSGDRTAQALINYAKRMAAPPVQEVRKPDSVAALKRENQLFFMYVGKREGPLWDAYFSTALALQPHTFFYSASEEVGREVLGNASSTPSVLVHKDQEVALFSKTFSTLFQWVNEERFETFPKLTSDTLREVMQTGKYLALAIVEEFRQGPHIPEPMREFRDRVEALVRRRRSLYHAHFQFGWMGSPELVNSLLMERVQLPFLLVLNASTLQHHQPEEEAAAMSAEAIEAFLRQVLNRTSPVSRPFALAQSNGGALQVQGGNGLHLHAARRFFDLKRNLEDMWRGNHYLMIVLFGLPGLFLVLIMWTCCCSDILDAEEEDEDEDGAHEKKE